MKYNYIITGGTFDHLHSGHKKFLKYAFEISREVLIGITTDRYINKNKSNQYIEKFDVRFRNLEHFLKTENLLKRARIVKIDNIYGDEVLDKSLDSILVTEETLNGAKLINKARVRNKLTELEIIIFPDVLKNAVKITSTKIRMGEIDKNGEPFFNEAWLRSDLNLEEKLKPLFQEILGEIIDINNFNFSKIDGSKTISIGDETTKILNAKNLKTKISVIDFKIQRKKIFSDISDLGFNSKIKMFEIKNNPSQINKEFWKLVIDLKNNLNKNGRVIVKVDGEEDLTILPFVILFPLGFNIFYGQPNEGMVYFKINLHIKRKVVMLLKKLKMNKY